MSEERSAPPHVALRRVHEEEAGVLVGRIAHMLRETPASPKGRFDPAYKPIFDEVWDLARYIADNED